MPYLSTLKSSNTTIASPDLIDNKVGLNATINDTIFWYKVDTKKNNLEDQINNNLENNKIIN